MKGTIKKKFIISHILLIVFFILSQSLFNLFLAEPIFTYQKTAKIKQSFEELKTSYTPDLSETEIIAENFNDTNGINVILWNETGILFSNQNYKMNESFPFKSKWDFSSVNEYTDNPEVEIYDFKKKDQPFKHLQLKGKFQYQGDTVYVLLSTPVAYIQNNVTLFTQFTIVISLIILFIGVFISIAIAKRMSDPICSIEKIARRISNMDFSCAADENVGTKEISMLAQSINQLSKKLRITIDNLNSANQHLQEDINLREQLDQLRQEFIASVSHEMKTPLGLLQIYTENLKNNIDGIDKDYYCDTILEETNRLNRMIVQMLEFSSIDTGFTTMNFDSFDFSSSLKAIVRQYEPMFAPYDVSCSIEDNIMIYGDMEYLHQVIRNLLNNAIQHTQEKNQIKIILRKQQKDLLFCVFNQGSQIPEEDLNHIWDAFYRVDKARTRNNHNNIGFGLYIVKTIVEKHGGSCMARNEVDGVTFSCLLPLCNEK